MHAVFVLPGRNLRLLTATLAGCVIGLLLNLSLPAEGAPRERKFRAIVPIKQSVAPGKSGQKSRTVSVRIPPPPIPDPEDSLFPEASVPEPEFAGPAGERPETAASTTPGEADSPPAPVSDDSSETSIGSEETNSDRGEGDAPGDPPSPESESEPQETPDGPTLRKLREEAHRLANLGLTYKFGADDPEDGGMDCSASMQYLLEKIGIEGVPRTSYDQYYWLRRKNLIRDVSGRRASKKLYEKLSPGDLIFWGGTWNSGHKVSHVMIYLGYNPEEEIHYVFGARGRTSKGLLGNGVDVFELDPDRGRLVAHGKIPGLIYE